MLWIVIKIICISLINLNNSLVEFILYSVLTDICNVRADLVFDKKSFFRFGFGGWKLMRWAPQPPPAVDSLWVARRSTLCASWENLLQTHKATNFLQIILVGLFVMIQKKTNCNLDFNRTDTPEIDQNLFNNFDQLC